MFYAVNCQKKYQLIPSRDIDDLRILESDWPADPKANMAMLNQEW